MALHEESHVAQRFLDVILFSEFLPGFEDGLNSFRASAGAGAMDSIATASMMRAQFAASGIEDRITHLPAQSFFDDIRGRGNGKRGALAFEEIDQGFAFGRNLLAQVIKGLLSVEPGWIIVRARYTAPDGSFGFTEVEGGLYVAFG